MNPNTATCLICMKNNCEDQSLILFDLLGQDWDNVTYLTKLQSVLTAEIDYFYYLQAIFEETLICITCLDDLNKAYEFKEKVIKVLDYWNTKFEENVTLQNKINEQAVIDVNDNNAIAEINTCTEPVSDINQTEVTNNEEVTNKDEVVEPTDPVVVPKEVEPECSNFPCIKCNQVFLTASELVNHGCEEQVKGEDEPKEKPPKKRKKQKSGTYECNICELHFSKSWKLNKHYETHTVDKKFICSYCNHAFKQSYHLREHLTTHTGERNFSCGVCGKKFQRMSSQKRHMRTHTSPPGEKCKKTPFLCNICGKSFPYSNGAQRHMRIHTGDKRYECDTCGRKFNQSTHLKVHLRTHTGEKPYICNRCGETFSLKASLHKHMNGHNGTKEDVKIFQNLEPNLSSQTHCTNNDDFDDEKKDFIIDDDIHLYDQGFLIACNQ